MRSSKRIIRRPYVPGALRLRDLKPDFQPLPLFSTNMGLLTKSRNILSDFFQANSDQKSTVAEPQTTVSSTNKKDTRLRPPRIRGRAMRFTNFRGEKRKREGDDGGFYRRKNRLLTGGEIKNVTEEEMRDKPLPCRSLLEIFYPGCASPATESTDWPDIPEEFTPEEPDEPQENSEDLTSELSCTLDNLTIIDDDNTIMRSPHTNSETRDDVEQSWVESIPKWDDTYCLGRRRSDGSTRVPLSADWTTVGALPDDSGRRSAPPTLDGTRGLTRQLAYFASRGHASMVSEDMFLNVLFESSLELNLEAAPESEHGIDVMGEVEDTDAKEEEEAELEETKLEEADANARVEAQAETKVEETEAATEAEEAYVTERVEVEIKANVGAEKEPELEETEAVTTEEEEAHVSARAEEEEAEEAEETEAKLEVEEANVTASVEEPEANRELEETEAGEANDGAKVEAQVEETQGQTGAKELQVVAEAKASEVIAEATSMQKVATTEETVETGEPEPGPASDLAPEPTSLTSEPVSEQVLEPTLPTPEPAAPTPKPALGLKFPTVDWPANQFAHIASSEADLCSRCRPMDAELASRTRAVREKLLEDLLIVEQNLGPYCSGVRG